MANISGITRAANVVTVTTALAHGLVVGQAAIIVGVADATFNGIYYVTGVTATTFTYNQTAANSSSSGGTTAPARQMVALGIQFGAQGVATISVAFWYPVLTPLPMASFTSAIPNSIAHPPTSAETTALSAGILIEELVSVQVPNSWAQGASLAKTEVYLQDLYIAKLAARNLLPPPGSVLGFWFDGTAWQQ